MQKAYQLERLHLQQRISLVSEDYGENLLNQVKQAQAKLEKLLQENEELNKPKKDQQTEQNSLEEIQNLVDLKKFYQIKVKECSEAVERNAEAKEKMCLRYSQLSQLCQELKTQLFVLNKNFTPHKKTEFLEKAYKTTQRQSAKSLSRLETKHNLLKSQFFKIKKQENSLSSIFRQVKQALIPNQDRLKILHSFSQDRSKVIRSLSQPRLFSFFKYSPHL